MRKMLAKLLSLTLCAAMLCAIPAFAAETASPAAAVKPDRLGPVRVWGRITRLENGSLLVQNDNEKDPNHEIIVRTGEAIWLDAVTGESLDQSKLKDGDTVYAWVGPAMNMSLPPQANAKVIVANIPMDVGVPLYHQVAAAPPVDPAAAPLTRVELVDTNGETLTITDQAQLQPYMTRNMVRLEMLRPGTEMMVWKDYSGTVTKVLVFPYAYKGTISWTEDGKVTLNDQVLSRTAKVKAPPATPIAALKGPEMLLPVRAVAEGLGMDVRWDAEKGAVVSQGGQDLFTAMPGGAIRRLNAEGVMEEYFGTCVVEKGVTYLSAGSLVSLLDLFIAG